MSSKCVPSHCRKGRFVPRCTGTIPDTTTAELELQISIIDSYNSSGLPGAGSTLCSLTDLVNYLTLSTLQVEPFQFRVSINLTPKH